MTSCKISSRQEGSFVAILLLARILLSCSEICPTSPDEVNLLQHTHTVGSKQMDVGNPDLGRTIGKMEVKKIQHVAMKKKQVLQQKQYHDCKRLGCLDRDYTPSCPEMCSQFATSPIRLIESLGAQQVWGQSLISISATNKAQGFQAATRVAEDVLALAYGYNHKDGTVLFKPTLAFGERTFRLTSEGALCYFVGSCSNYPEDTGFALNEWVNYEVKNAGVLLIGDVSITMGNVILTKKDGSVVKVDKTWAFEKDTEDNLKIVLHHSSIPFKPDDVAPPLLPVTVSIPVRQRVADITEEEVLAAQQAWGKALVRISTLFDDQGIQAATAEAELVLDSAYGYTEYGMVLFKPTLAFGSKTFRLTRAGALAYFVGGNPDYPDDTGFALKHWRQYEIKNAAIRLQGISAFTMGNVLLTDSSGKVTTVDKTWGFVKGTDGTLHIILHHSSLPYSPPR